VRELRALKVSPRTLDDLGRLLLLGGEGEQAAWLDTESGELVRASSFYGLDDVSEEEDAWDEPSTGGGPVFRHLPDWMQAEREQVEAIVADTTGRYLEVPPGGGLAAVGILEEFARSLADSSLERLVRAQMAGRGAVRRVKDALRARGELDRWQRFESARGRDLAVTWLRSQGYQASLRGGTPRLKLVEPAR
jgi:hypothetical protein